MSEVGLPATYCGFPMSPDGPECLREVGHDGYHHGAHDTVQWSYTSCWNEFWRDGWGQVHCIKPKGHASPCGEL